MQNSNQFNNIFRQIQNGYIRRSSSEEEASSPTSSPFLDPPEKWKVSDIPPFPQSSDTSEWEGYVSYLHQLLFAYMLGSVEVLSAKEYDWVCKNNPYDPNHTLIHEADYFHKDKPRKCYIVGVRPNIQKRLHHTEFAREVTNNIYIAHQHLARAYEDEAFGLEEGEPI